QGRDADGDRRDQRQGWGPWQEARAGGRRPRVELAAVRGKGAPAPDAGQGRGRLRLLDERIAQVGAAGIRGIERPALLPGAIRRRGVVQERVLYWCGAEPAGDPRRR